MMTDAEFRRRAHALLARIDGDSRPGDAWSDERAEVAVLLAAGAEVVELEPGERRVEHGYSIRRRTASELRECAAAHPDWLPYTVIPGHPIGFATVHEALEWIRARTKA